MYKEEAVQIAIQHPRSRGRRAPSAAAERSGSPARDLLRAYLGLLSWYVKDGRTPAGDGGAAAGHLPHRRFTFDAAGEEHAARVPPALGVGR